MRPRLIRSLTRRELRERAVLEAAWNACALTTKLDFLARQLGLLSPSTPSRSARTVQTLAPSPLDRFIADRLIHQEGARLQSSVAYGAFVDWCSKNGVVAGSHTGFSRQLAQRGYRRAQSRVIWWLGIDLSPAGPA
jgi:hypothetical protein